MNGSERLIQERQVAGRGSPVTEARPKCTLRAGRHNIAVLSDPVAIKRRPEAVRVMSDRAPPPSDLATIVPT
jgi:hypothetical protein